MSRAVLIVHGIRTSRKKAERWMPALAERLAGPDLRGVHLYEYGWLAGTAIRFPLIGGAVRKRHVRRFQKWVAATRRRYGQDVEIQAVGHSFGTYLIGRSMTQENAPRAFYGRVVLMGCILSSRDDWQDKAGHYTGVLNLWSREDEVVEFSTFGQAGWKGFTRAPVEVENEEMEGFEHQDYTRPGRAWEELVAFLAVP